jgi:hypothetical protein
MLDQTYRIVCTVGVPKLSTMSFGNTLLMYFLLIQLPLFSVFEVCPLIVSDVLLTFKKKYDRTFWRVYCLTTLSIFDQICVSIHTFLHHQAFASPLFYKMQWIHSSSNFLKEIMEKFFVWFWSRWSTWNIYDMYSRTYNFTVPPFTVSLLLLGFLAPPKYVPGLCER